MRDQKSTNQRRDAPENNSAYNMDKQPIKKNEIHWALGLMEFISDAMVSIGVPSFNYLSI